MSGDDHGADGGIVASFAAGSRIADYFLEEQIGRGGMAVVFKARDERLGRLVALKILAPELAGDADFQRRFVRESRAAAAIDDPHGAGLVHRDVKPSNMLMDVLPGRPDHVYLSDFGLSKAVASTSGLTAAGAVMGTLDYIAPEQIGGKAADQVLECAWDSGQPAYIWTFPTENVFIVAVGATRFSAPNSWWTKNQQPLNSPSPSAP